MKVELLHHTPLWIAAHAIRTCHNSFDKSDTEKYYICNVCGNDYTKIPDDKVCNGCGACNDFYRKIVRGKKDKELIHRVGNKMKHASTLEHLVYTFYIQGISRACLQELARHRIASLSVKSTRYTTSRELKFEKPFVNI